MTTCAATHCFLKESHIPHPDYHHVSSDLPCSEDIDLEPASQPSYLPQEMTEIQHILGNFLPIELSDVIIDMAEIWPYVVISRNSFTPALTALEGPDGNAQWCYLVSPPVPSLKCNNASLPTAVRKVKFNIKTYNSCWGVGQPEKGKLQGLKTWFEASILNSGDPEAESYNSECHPQTWFTSLSGARPKLLNEFLLQEDLSEPQPNPFDERKRWNVTNDTPTDDKWQEISWANGSDFVDSLTVGDRIVLIVRALTPGWLTTVFNAKMEIYYSLPSSDR